VDFPLTIRQCELENVFVNLDKSLLWIEDSFMARRKTVPNHDDDFMKQLRAKRGALSELAFKLGIRPQATHLWHRVPLDRVSDVSKILDVPKSKIRPDHYSGDDDSPTKRKLTSTESIIEG
jgi:hypothetical protein